MFEFSVGEDCGGAEVVMEPQPDEQPHTYGLCGYRGDDGGNEA
jgi:hypothetical protein